MRTRGEAGATGGDATGAARAVGRDDRSYPAALARALGDDAPGAIMARGDLGLIARPWLALFCSRRCPGSVIVPLYALMTELGAAGVAVAGGFHAAVERDCLALLLRGAGPLIVCPAREIAAWRPPPALRAAIGAGRLLALSPYTAATDRRPTATLAAGRNRFVAALAAAVLIAHAAPGGRTAALAAEVAAWGTPLLTIASDDNRALVGLGARAIGPGAWRGVVPG